MAKKKKKNLYFTKVHQDAIVEFAQTTDLDRREELYRDIIEPVFDELVDKIVYTYKFTTLPNIDYLKSDCKNWLVTVLNKFDPDKGSKAFSYFTIVVKNWFIQKTKKRSRKMQRETSYEEEIKKYDTSIFVVEPDFDENREKQEFMENFYGELDSWLDGRIRRLLGKNDILVIEAIKEIFDNRHELDLLNKKAVYFYLREITGLNTKQITRSIKKIKPRYSKFRDRWEDGEI